MGNMQQLRIQPPAYLGRGRMAMTSKYMSPDLYTLLQQHNYLIQAQMDPTSELSRRVPPYIHHYHTLFPLEDISNDDHPSYRRPAPIETSPSRAPLPPSNPCIDPRCPPLTSG